MKRVVLLLCLLVGAPAVFAAADEVNRVVELTGLDKLLDHLPRFAQDSLNQGKGAIDPEVAQAISKHIPAAYEAAAIRKDMLRYLNEHNDAPQLRQYLEFLGSPLAKELGELEGQAKGPEFEKFVRALPKEFANSERGKMLQRLDIASRTSEFSIGLQTALFRNVFTAVDPFLESDMRLKEGELDKMTDEIRNSLLASTQAMTLNSYAYAYRNVHDDKLAKYLKEYEEKSSRWAVTHLGNGVMYALNQAGVRLLDGVRKTQFRELGSSGKSPRHP